MSRRLRIRAFFVGRHRRNSELVLIILGGAVTTGAYVLASLGRLSSIPANVVPFLIAVLGLFVAAHIATRFLAPEGDGLLLPLAGLLNGLGYVFIARLDDELAAQQAVWTFLGVGLYVATLIVVRRIRDLEGWRYTMLFIGLGLLLLPMLPVIGQQINGSRIWVRIGPINFQPGEFAKLALAIFFASYIVDKRELFRSGTWKLGPLRLPEPRHAGPLLLGWGASLLVMIVQRDLGTSLLFFMLFLIVLWVGTERLAYLATGMVLFVAGALVAWRRFSHVQTRVDAWIDPWEDPLGGGFQIIESQFGLASGGLTGTGPGRGYPQRVPAAETDFIFSTIGEELGLIGATAVLMAFVLMIGSGLRAALGAPRPFAKLLATGLTGLIGVQAFIIIAGVIRLLPLTGVTLPFVSYGGSSLLANYALLALLMRISDEQVDRPADAPSAGPPRPRRRTTLVAPAPAGGSG
ncbi:MAG: FtsW/RodA/SpoVE family cell cycle protein [Actinomycetota bacterium]